MKTNFLYKIALLSTLCCTATQAATSFQLDPVGGSVSGEAGLTVGWGFTLINTENYLVVTSASFDSPSTLGNFTDYISAPDNFFVVGPGLGGSTIWAQNFHAGDQTGVGGFSINAGAAPGDTAFGEIVLTYDLFAVNPNNPIFNPDTDGISFGNRLSASATVTTAVPEPGESALAAGLLSLTGYALSRRRYRRE
jgi:hypothetical protein